MAVKQCYESMNPKQSTPLFLSISIHTTSGHARSSFQHSFCKITIILHSPLQILNNHAMKCSMSLSDDELHWFPWQVMSQ